MLNFRTRKTRRIPYVEHSFTFSVFSVHAKHLHAVSPSRVSRRCQRETQNQKPRQRNQSIIPTRSQFVASRARTVVTRVHGYIRSRGCPPLSDCLRGPGPRSRFARVMRPSLRRGVERGETKKKKGNEKGANREKGERVAKKKKRVSRNFPLLFLHFLFS